MRAGGTADRLILMSRTYAELSGLMTLMTGDEKHGPSATSTLDVLWVLYDQVLRVSPELRRYGTPFDHAAWQGLDAAGIRRSVTRFLGMA
jgi:hypothetical protein